MKLIVQKGFTLLEMSIVLALATMGIMATLKMRATQIQIDNARSVAQIYERLNNAAGSYMTLYYKEIIEKAKVNPGCGRPAYEIPDALSNSVVLHGTDCKITLETNGQEQAINNFMQPTPKELEKLGLLTGNDGGYQIALPLPSSTSLIANNVSNDPKFGVQGAAARNGMAFLIQLRCVGANPEVTEPILETGNCNSHTYDLSSLVYNIQPYSEASNNDILLYRTLDADGGGRIYLSDKRFFGNLKSKGGVGELKNPVFYKPSGGKLNPIGAPLILAMRNGYGSSGMDEFVRRDGSTTLTGAWNVGQQDITNVAGLSANTGVFGAFLNTTEAALNAALKATSAFISGTLNVGGKVKLDDDLTVSGATALGGNLAVSGASSLAGNLAVAGGSSLGGNLAVAGESTLGGNLKVTGDTTLKGGTKVADFRLENEAVFGGTCNPSTQTLARASSASADYGSNLRLLVCDPNSKKWTRPQADYKSQIQDFVVSLASLSVDVNSLAAQTEELKLRKTYVEYFDIQWNPATFKGEETVNGNKREIWESETWAPVQGGRTWKPTPWKCNPSDLNTREAQNSSSFFYGGTTYKPPFTPPLIFSLDGGSDADQTVVYDVGCINKYNSGNPPHWHVAVGQKQRNIAGGNKCGSGLSSNLNDFAWRTNQGKVNSGYSYYENGEPCRLFNIYTPNFNSVEIKARFMVFFKQE